MTHSGWERAPKRQVHLTDVSHLTDQKRRRHNAGEQAHSEGVGKCHDAARKGEQGAFLLTTPGEGSLSLSLSVSVQSGPHIRMKSGEVRCPKTNSRIALREAETLPSSDD